MKSIDLQVITDTKLWDEFVAGQSDGHPQQLSGWGKLKEHNGWENVRLGVVENGQIVAGAQMLFLRAPIIGYKMAYIPRGPVWAKGSKVGSDELLTALGEYARKQGATLLKIEPAKENMNLPDEWRVAKRQILHPVTSVVDLSPATEEEILKTFKSDARYSIRKAARKGVWIETVDNEADLKIIWNLYQDTAERAGFNLYSYKYYQRVYRYLGGNTRVWIAYDEDEPAGFLWAAHVQHVAIYLYGGSNDVGRRSLANYLLQWEAMRYYRALGVKQYDLNGHVNDGVSSFKNKFAREQVEYIGTYDLPLKPLQYAVWERLLPALTPILRRVKSLLR